MHVQCNVLIGLQTAMYNHMHDYKEKTLVMHLIKLYFGAVRVTFDVKVL